MALANVHHFTTEEFLAIDGLPRRVELIEGVICDMSPEGPVHALAQESVVRALMAALPLWHVVGGGSVKVTDTFCPIPDLGVYPHTATTTDSAFDGRQAALVVEVGVSTAWSDRSVKVSAYARGNVEEVWLVAPELDMLTCYKEPAEGRYQNEVELRWPGGLEQAVSQLKSRLTDK